MRIPAFVFCILHLFMHIFVFYIPVFNLNYTLLFADESLLFFRLRLSKVKRSNVRQNVDPIQAYTVRVCSKNSFGGTMIQLGNKTILVVLSGVWLCQRATRS